MRRVPRLVFHVFLWDRTTGVTRLVSHKAGAPETEAGALQEIDGISADGRFVTFSSLAADLAAGVEDGNNRTDAFLYDRETGENVLVSRASGASRPGAYGAGGPRISADGRFVTFLSTSADLLPGGTGAIPANVFRFDRQTGAVTLASRALTGPGVPANNLCFTPLISADGSVIAFSSAADNLVIRDFNRNPEGPLVDAFAAVLP